MSMTLNQVLKLQAEGRKVRKDAASSGMTEVSPYPAGSSEHRWWSHGWLLEDGYKLITS